MTAVFCILPPIAARDILNKVINSYSNKRREKGHECISKKNDSLFD